MFVLIDNYDSFTWNLVHFMGELGARVTVYRNDKISPDEVLAMAAAGTGKARGQGATQNEAEAQAQAQAHALEGIVLSPGPCTPDEAGICLDLVRANAARANAAREGSGAGDGPLPLLGVCLGHQAIGQAYGGRVVRAAHVMHGKLSRIRHTGEGVFAGLPDAFEATRYHSLIVAREGLPDTLRVTAQTDDGGGRDGIIMGLAHATHPVHGVQFHPESIASEHGHAILKNFIRLARGVAGAVAEPA